MAKGYEKQCSKCRKYFPISNFPEKKGNSDGYSSYCFSCHEAAEADKKSDKIITGCKYPASSCQRNRILGLCCLTCTKYHDCEQACKNTPEKCGYEGELV